MSEGDFTPGHYRPKPLTRAQLREMEKRFAEASDRIDEIKDLEDKHREKNIENPDWV